MVKEQVEQQPITPPNSLGKTKEPIIQIEHLVKQYGSLTAVKGIDLVVYAGEIFGILGPNGAGKTTTLEMIEGLREPDGGTITLAGFDAVKQSERVRQVIGVQLQTTALFDYLSSAELIELFGGLYNVEVSQQWVDRLLAMVDLQEKRDSYVNELSGGQRQRLSITLALVNRPKVVFLDEPTTGLDPAARRDLWQTIRDIRAEGTTVVLTTHYMEEADVLCDRVAVMDHGQVIACDTPAALIRNLGKAATIHARVLSGVLQTSELTALAAVTGAETNQDQPDQPLEIELHTTNVQSTLVDLLDLATRQQVVLADLRSTQASLEDVFLSLTGRTYDTENATTSENDSAKPKQKAGRSLLKRRKR